MEAPQPTTASIAVRKHQRSPSEWAELDGQAQVDLAVQAQRDTLEAVALGEVRGRECCSIWRARPKRFAGTDAKAEALLELIYKLQQEENDPALKVLIFTEFVPTQAMLAACWRVVASRSRLLNGGMDLDAR
jgi:hypothetical protein